MLPAALHVMPMHWPRRYATAAIDLERLACKVRGNGEHKATNSSLVLPQPALKPRLSDPTGRLILASSSFGAVTFLQPHRKVSSDRSLRHSAITLLGFRFHIYLVGLHISTSPYSQEAAEDPMLLCQDN